jgi:PAS domain S-box-containing protein
MASRETALMREREHLNTLCNTGDGVFIVDANKRIVRWNKGAEKILGYSEGEALNHDCFQMISGKIAPDKTPCSPNCRIHANALAGVPQTNFDMRAQTSNGDPVWLNMTIISPVDLNEPFIAHIVRDVTRKKRAELALEQFLADLGPSSLTTHDFSTGKPIISSPAVPRSTMDDTAIALSGREIEVLRLLAEGLSTKILAQKLNISHFTARNHIQNILVKLDLHSKAQAVSYAFKKGIL